MKTKVIFRTFKDTGEPIALFPEEPADRAGDFCTSYMHTGQHSAASPSLPGATRPATPEEIAPLKAELESIGYALDIRQNVSFQMHRTRRNNAR